MNLETFLKEVPGINNFVLKISFGCEVGLSESFSITSPKYKKIALRKGTRKTFSDKVFHFYDHIYKILLIIYTKRHDYELSHEFVICLLDGYLPALNIS